MCYPTRKRPIRFLQLSTARLSQDCLQRVDKAYRTFFDDIQKKKSGLKIKVGYPRFKKSVKNSCVRAGSAPNLQGDPQTQGETRARLTQ